MEPNTPEFKDALAALTGKVTDAEVLALLLRQLRDSELAAPTIIQVDGLQDQINALVGKVKESAVASFEGDLQASSTSADVIKRHIAHILATSLDTVLRNWLISNVYMVPVRDERAYADYGIAAALLSDVAFARQRSGLAPLPDNILRDAVKESMAMSSALLKEHVDFTPPNIVPMSVPNIQAYARSVAAFPDFRHAEIANSPAAKSTYADFLAKYLSDRPLDANPQSPQNNTQRNVAIALGVIGVAVTYVLCKRSHNKLLDRDKRDLALEQEAYSKMHYARTDYSPIE